MEATLERIQENLAQLRADIAKYRRLAEQRAAVDQLLIAEKLREFVADLESKADEMERLTLQLTRSAAPPEAVDGVLSCTLSDGDG